MVTVKEIKEKVTEAFPDAIVEEVLRDYDRCYRIEVRLGGYIYQFHKREGAFKVADTGDIYHYEWEKSEYPDGVVDVITNCLRNNIVVISRYIGEVKEF